MSVIQDLAKSHVNEYQARLDKEGWSDGLCQEILVSFANKIVEECAKYLDDNAHKACDDVLYTMADGLRREKVRL